MHPRTPSNYTVAICVLLLLGASLRIASYVAPGSLRWDELTTALNVTERGWGQLLEPLGHKQVAPIGFVVAEKVGVALLGPNERGLRFFPLLASLVSLLLFWRLASRYLTGVTLTAALALFSFSSAPVWYARKAKQYSGDICSVLVLLVLASRFLEGRYDGRRSWIAGAIGGVVILFSQPAALVAAGLFLVLLHSRWRERDPLTPLVPLGSGWALGAIAQVLTSVRLAPPETQDFMSTAWTFAFLPAPWSSPDAIFWLPQQLFDFVGFFIGLMDPDSPWEVAFVGIYAALAVAGFLQLARSDKTGSALLVTPLAVAIFASAVRLLPLNGRLMIYAGPTILVACLAGVYRISISSGNRLRYGLPMAGLGLAIAPAALLPLMIPILNDQEDARPVLQEIRAQWRPRDSIYVYSGANLAMEFYGERLGLDPWIPGGDHGPDSRAYLHEVDTLRGDSRAWFFHTHSIGCHVNVIRSYMETIGTELVRIEDPHGVTGMHETEAYLFSFTDEERLARSSAATHPIFDRRDPRCRDPGLPAATVIKRRLRDLVARIL